MATVSVVEKELIKSTKVKPDKYEDRQDFLAALVKAVDKFEDDDFDGLSDEAAEWHTKKAAPALLKKKEIPDFVEEAEDAPEDDAETDTDESGEDPAEDDAEGEQDHEAEAEAEAENEAEEAAEETKPAKKAPKGKAKPVEKAKPAAKAKVKAKVEDEEETEAEAKPAKKKAVRTYEGLSGERDRFNCILGTKTADAVALYEKGASAKQINEALDGRYYNILGKLQKDGHKVEKLEGGVWKLTHKDDVGKTKAKGKAK